MQKASSGSWWSFGFGKPADAPQTDYADMGTAFGLDASMDTLPAPDEPAPAETKASPVPGRPKGRTDRR